MAWLSRRPGGGNHGPDLLGAGHGHAVVGLMTPAAMELIGVIARDEATDSSTATLVNNPYGPPVIIQPGAAAHTC